MKFIYYRLFYIFLLAFVAIHHVDGQSKGGVIKGHVYNEIGTPVSGATVIVLNNNSKVITDKSGFFLFNLLSDKEYSIQVSFTGKELQVQKAYLKQGHDILLSFSLVENITKLSEVNIRGESKNQKARNEVIKAEIIDTKAAQSKAITLVELMNRSAGVRVRQSGGLGSNTNVMLNGFQGKSIKMFKDGIPTDYLGASYNISSIPVNMLERVEVYKGVLPTEIGADALGGAINMVSRIESTRYAALSYEFGSFNTHRVSVNLKNNTDRSRFYWGLDGFYNYSDNDYKVTANISDQDKSTVSPSLVRLFHNQFKQAYIELYGGLANLRWADELRVGLTAFRIDRDNQFGALMEKPFGAAKASEHASIIPTIRYKKDLLDHKLSVDQFLVYSRISGRQIDTLSGSYDWYGIYHPPLDVNKRGESGNPTLASHIYSNFTSRTGLIYRLTDNNSLTLNVVFNDYSRTGKDPYGPKTSGSNPIDLQSLSTSYKKFVAGLGWKSQFSEDRLENLFQVKAYYAKTSGQEVNVNTGYLNENTTKADASRLGLAESFKYNVSKRTYVRLSGELATRLPEQAEILGNGGYVLSNFNVKPEKSSNVNLGIRTTPNEKIDIELNSFFRITKDMIITAPVNLLYSQSVNVESVKGVGFEADLRYSPSSWFSINGNATYQDFRLYHINNPLMDYLEGARLRNTPYFFANVGASFAFSNILKKTDKVQAYYNMGYVHQYYLNYIPKNTEPDGFLGLWGKAKVDAPNIIPSQTVHSIGLLWQPKATLPLTINVDCKNLFDAAVFDNFKIQNAGRSFHLKLNYILKY